ncbi:NADH-quinone oxidoreductase subunit C [Propionibacteriaceae bacterium Y1923]|uniref:NADH-quinone oxidoreductase subunit C n=1 Tax=Aestuariimicrobium sp. Y1814 TaxID=3418742 RepID=UPI003C2812F7
MSENKPDNASPNTPAPDAPAPEKVTAPEAAPKEGVEREDSRSSDATGTVDVGPASSQAHDPAAPQVLRVRQGMWGDQKSTDTSGYGEIARTITMPEASQQPYGGWFDQVADRMAELVPGFSTGRTIVDRGEITFFVRPEKMVELARALRDDAQLRFEMCTSVSGVHYPNSAGEELHVVYHLLSITHNRRIRLEVGLPEDNPHTPSLISVYPHTDWHERETWDMFGVIFDGHHALTRILMPDDWHGHPQRKDYPLGGVDVEYKGAVVPPPHERRSYS